MHNVAFTFSGKKCDQYGVRMFFPVLKLDLDVFFFLYSWDLVPSKRALETSCNVLSTKGELLTLDFAFC